MSRPLNVLFAWELGLGLGHVWRHLDLATLLQERGHVVSFAVKDLRLAATALVGSDFNVVQTPVRQKAGSADPVICSHADVLAHHGMAEPAGCHSLLAAWAQCFKCERIDLVVIDHAPGALFAAKCLGIKTLELATGFGLPPPLTPFPSFRPWEGLSTADLLLRESRCLAAMNPFALGHGRPAFPNLAQALTADVALLATFAELDHYPQRAQGRYIGPTESYQRGESVPWPGHGKRRVFVYLHHLRECAALLSQLNELEMEVIAYCPDVTASERQALAAPHLNMVERPVHLASVLDHCDLAITNGGHGVVSACVLQGVPVLAIPQHIEQRLMVDCLRRCGLGEGLMQANLASDLQPSVDRLLGDASYKDAGARLKQKYRTYSLPQTLQRLANTVEGLVNAPQ
jgi:UDP:flavonoid glycosyltransferase YjiC (YdhE family)